MRKIVRCMSILMLAGFLLSACSKNNTSNLLNDGIVIKDAVNENLNNEFQRYDLLMTKYINDTKIYGISVENGIYNKVQVEINDNKKEFDWYSLGDDNYLPRIYYFDINGDNKNECLFIMSNDDGNGKVIQDLHLLNPENLEEINIESVTNFVLNNIHLKNENGLMSVLLDNIVIFIYDLDKIDLNSENQELLDIDFENILSYIKYDNITYNVNGDNLSTSIDFYICNIKTCNVEINYICQDNEIICSVNK